MVQNQTRLTFYEHYDASPSFSPDGSKIVFARSVLDFKRGGLLRSHLFTMNVDGTEVKKIIDGEAWFSAPKYSHDGKKIAFQEVWQGHQNATGIGMMDADGSNAVKIKKCFCHYPSFSPDDKKTLFVADFFDEGEYELFTIMLDSHALRRIPLYKSLDLDISSPGFFEDGTKILFLNREYESGGQICIINLDGTGFYSIGNTS
jgi:TolB protein